MLKNYFFHLLLAGIAGFILGFSIRLAWEGNQFIIAQWEDEPMVVICPDSRVTPLRVQRAIEWWGIREYKISHYHYDESNSICGVSTYLEGIIFIRATGDTGHDFYAITSRLAFKEKMISASILLPNRHRDMPRLLEHELGHALGLGHVDVVGHMMHPVHEYGGEKFWIPD